ncbi:pancreatic triacylglycerol lipase-like [Harmonia axyridis]|uniref:pancreatic triacylglycerol lipase-like n=1 Tax=Harmonia axyridis TaxID=115357 RepID=UPI001E274EC1|nr:pancreatic triacylglycerol lipase-like [Harmonia axyridis]
MENMKLCLCFLSFLLALDLCSSELTFKYLTLYNKEGRLMKKEDIQKDSVNVLKPITVVINGLSSVDNAWVNALVDEYLEKQVHNVFLLDLEDHEEVMKNDTIMSEQITDFIGEIYNKTGEEYLHWHIIGISSSGFYTAIDVGRKMFNNYRKVDRITGIDPTYHLIEIREDLFVDHDDAANLVDVVHSNTHKFKGELKSYGHVDFYIVDINCRGKDDLECGRLNAIKMFKRSVNSLNLTAVKCLSLEEFETEKCAGNNRVLFGENMPNNADGVYMLKNE